MPWMPAIAQEESPTEEVTSAIYRFVLDLTDSGGVAALAETVLPRMLRIALILLAAYFLNRLLRRGIKRFVRNLQSDVGLSRFGALRARAPLADTTPMDIGRATMRAETLAGVLRSIGGFTIWTLAIVMVLSEFAINLGPLIAGAGIVGVALGFGAQKLVQDFLSGMFMLIEDQYGLGDIVDTGEAVGRIEAITLRTTRLRDVQGTVWHVPNGQINRIGNLSQQWARSLIDFGVAYDTDVTHAMTVIKGVLDDVAADPDWRTVIMEEPEVWGVEAFGPSEILIRSVVKVQPGKQFNINREIRKRMKAAFDAEGIEIPFPQRTVWVRDDSNGAGDSFGRETPSAPPSSPATEPGEARGRGGSATDEGETPARERTQWSEVPDDVDDGDGDHQS